MVVRARGSAQVQVIATVSTLEAIQLLVKTMAESAMEEQCAGEYLEVRSRKLRRSLQDLQVRRTNSTNSANSANSANSSHALGVWPE